MNSMRIIHLSTNDFQGGAARATHRLNGAVKKLGVDSTMMVRHKVTNHPSVVVSVESRFHKFSSNVLRALGSRLLSVSYKDDNEQGKFSSLLFYRSRIPLGYLNSFDIVCLYWICDGLLSPENLSGINVPIVWRLSDMWPFTGGCHYSGGCNNYIDKCGNCPILGSRSPNDVSRKLWERKNKAWKDLNMVIVAPSHWISQCARSSSLFRNRRIEVIPTGVDVRVFRPRNRQSARKKLNLPTDRQLILFGAAGATSDPRKGYVYLREAIAKLGTHRDKIELVVFGDTEADKELVKGIKTHFMGRIDNDVLLSSIYNAADVFVAPSKEENLPNTVIEAMSCGIPCVAFRIGGMPDLIEHKKTGYLAQSLDSEDLAQGILWVLNDSNRWQALSHQAREKAEQQFALAKVARQYMDLYEDLLKGKG